MTMIIENVTKCLLGHKRKTQNVAPNFVWEHDCNDKKGAHSKIREIFPDYRVLRTWTGQKGSNNEPKILSDAHSPLVLSILYPPKKGYKVAASSEIENILFDETNYNNNSGDT